MKKIKKFYHHHLARPIYSTIKPLQPILKFKKRTFFDKFKVKIEGGKRFWLYNNAYFWDTELFWQGFERLKYENRTREVWCFLAERSKVIFDIGANTGWFSMMAKAYNRNAKIFAFEPQPNIYKVLKKNNEINDFNICCEQLALSDQKGKLPFYNTGDTTFSNINTMHGSLNMAWRTKGQKSISVEVSRLDSYIEKNDIPSIDLMKIDVETLEYEVLIGYGEFLHKHLPILILEIQNEKIGTDIGSVLGNKYTYYWIDEEVGLIEVSHLGRNNDQENRNYLLCPNRKKNLIMEFVSE
ncbi:FkbM family methyltransferase [Echinicola sp. 20G]|uniref:FkbM family methyltransferase n=1 Tax=Echinicola sp. 20G TaxID=2781961 RepID=UPI00191108B8|nr:FkbM family methyltransferase [Echinicola sp. 20G]